MHLPGEHVITRKWETSFTQLTIKHPPFPKHQLPELITSGDPLSEFR